MGAADRLHSCFRKAEVLHLALLNQVLHRSSGVFDRNIRIHAMLVEQINDIGPQSLERGLGDFPDVLWPAVEPRLFTGAWIKFEPEFGGDHYLLTERRQRFTHEFFVREGAVHLDRKSVV